MSSDLRHPGKTAKIVLMEDVPHLPIVSRLAGAARSAGLRIPPETRVLAVQHMVRTNVTLFRTLFELGLEPVNTFLIGKGYSTSSACQRTLREAGVHVFEDLSPPQPGWYGETRTGELNAFWQTANGPRSLQARQKILLMDVGGRLLSLAETDCQSFSRVENVIGIEQTTSGIRRLQSTRRAFPIINVAQAAAKSFQEPPLLAANILDHLDSRRPGRWPNVRVGVIGLGGVGQAIVTELVARGFDVMGWDRERSLSAVKAIQVPRLDTLVENTEIAFGCTGEDVFKDGFPVRYHENLVLVSCSSEDIEFNTLLRKANCTAHVRWPFQDVAVEGPRGHVIILNESYPLNFDASGISLDEKGVQVTTALMLEAVLAAGQMLGGDVPAEFVQLPISLQAVILKQ